MGSCRQGQIIHEIAEAEASGSEISRVVVESILRTTVKIFLLA